MRFFVKETNNSKLKPDFIELKILIASIPCIIVLVAVGLFITYGIETPALQCVLSILLGLVYTFGHFKYCIWLVNKGVLVWPRKVTKRWSNECK